MKRAAGVEATVKTALLNAKNTIEMQDGLLDVKKNMLIADVTAVLSAASGNASGNLTLEAKDYLSSLTNLVELQELDADDDDKAREKLQGELNDLQGSLRMYL